LLWPPPEPMTGIFNVAVLDFGERESSDANVRASAEGRWIADRVYDGLRDLDVQLKLDGDTGGVVEIGRLEQHVEGPTPTDLAQSLVEVADESNATIVVHGVLELSEPPYRFTPILYLTQHFNGGEELTGENAFGGPIQVTLPLGDSGPGLENRLALAESLRSRVEALQFFTLGLAYLQIDKADRALELFARADQVDGSNAPKEVLQRYPALTGRPALPPAWSFGLWLTTSFTTNYDEATVTSFIPLILASATSLAASVNVLCESNPSPTPT